MSSGPPVRDPRWIAGQVLLASTLVLAFPAASLLRSAHDQTPRLAGSPFGSLLGLGVLALLALHVVGRRRGADQLPAPDRRRGITLAMLLPLLVVLLGEKWVASELLASAYDWIPGATRDVAQADAAFRLWTALALLGCSLAGVWVMRQIGHRLRGVLAPEKVLPGLALLAAATAVPAVLLAALHLGLPGSQLVAARPWSATLALACAAQIVRGCAEELYFRGLLQTGAARLLAQTPLGDSRLSRLGAIALVSVGFTIEHFDPASADQTILRQIVFVFGVSCALGTLLAASRNLYLVAGAHVAVNLAVGHLIPLPADRRGQPLIDGDVVAVLVLIGCFVGVTLAHRRRGNR